MRKAGQGTEVLRPPKKRPQKAERLQPWGPQNPRLARAWGPQNPRLTRAWGPKKEQQGPKGREDQRLNGYRPQHQSNPAQRNNLQPPASSLLPPTSSLLPPTSSLMLRPPPQRSILQPQLQLAHYGYPQSSRRPPTTRRSTRSPGWQKREAKLWIFWKSQNLQRLKEKDRLLATS